MVDLNHFPNRSLKAVDCLWEPKNLFIAINKGVLRALKKLEAL